jgi:hypothetical protein
MAVGMSPDQPIGGLPYFGAYCSAVVRGVHRPDPPGQCDVRGVQGSWRGIVDRQYR